MFACYYLILLYHNRRIFLAAYEPPRPCNASVIDARLKSRPLGGICTTSVANARWRNDEWAVCLSLLDHDY